jgi:hypothetical protein
MNMEVKDDNLQFDLLVDGELNEEDRHRLLTRLDGEPDGWRRCALAFLEAQCWKHALCVLGEDAVDTGKVGATGSLSASADTTRADKLPVAPTSTVAPPLPVAPSPGRWRWRPNRVVTALAMAASFLVAMWLGTVVRDVWQGHRGVPGGSASPQVAQQNEPQPFTNPGPLPDGPWRMVTVSAPSVGTGPNASFSLPAVERDSIDDQWLGSLPPAIPENVRQALSRAGHEVQQRRALVPIPLNDGRRLIVPVDEVDVNYVGNPSY